MDFYLSELLGNPVYNQSKERIGYLTDLLLGEISKPHPKIQGLIIKRGRNKGLIVIPEHDVQLISAQVIRLATDVVDLTPFSQKNEEILLAKDVYDKQIVDIDDRRLTRVNDLLLEEEHNVLRLKGVDVSVVGILKRLSIPTFGGILIKRNIVDWEDVQFLGGESKMKFNVQYKNLESLHPVDIARIIFEGPGYKQGSRVLASLKDPIAADIIEELSPKLQRNLIESMKLEDVADVVDHMPSHKAADLLVTLGANYSQKILPLLNKGHTEEIKTLLNYPEYSTGAYMTTEYFAIPSGIPVESVFKRIRESEDLPDFMLYFYVLENEFSNRLAGVLSVYELFAADGRDRVESKMVKRLLTVSASDPIKDTLKKMYRYNLSAIPVIKGAENKLLGVVTFRDAISIYLPKRWKVRTARVFSNGISA